LDKQQKEFLQMEEVKLYIIEVIEGYSMIRRYVERNVTVADMVAEFVSDEGYEVRRKEVMLDV
jgi:hypothetical protein